MAHTGSRPLVVLPQKNVGLAVLLAIVFGPLGMLYSSILGAVIMGILSVILGIVTLGFGLLVTWPVCAIWAGLAARSHNHKLLAKPVG